MNPYSIPTLIGSLLALAMAIIVLSKDRRSEVNITFSLFSLSLCGWLSSFTIAYSVKNPHIADLFGRAGCTWVDFAGPFFYHFVAAFLKLRKELKYVYLTYLLVISILALSLTTNYIFQSTPHKYYWGYYPNAGPLHLLAIILHSAIMLRSIILLYGFIKRRDPSISKDYYNHIKYIFWGIWILVFPGLTDYLPKYGLEIYPLGWAFVIIFCAIVGCGIVKHRLMDINIVFRGTLIYSLLIGFITAIFVVMILLLERFFQGFAGYRSLLASGVTAFVIAISFNPVKNKIQAFVDRYFFKGTTEEIVQENIKLHQELVKHDRAKASATLAASTVHEIKNPLATIKTFIDFLPERHADKNFINNFMRLVAPQIEKINFTVQQLLDFSKPAIPNLRQVKIYKVLDETLELLSNDFIKHKIKSQTQFSDDNAMVSADPNQLKQVFLNLFLNSIDAMPQGGNLLVSGKTYNDSVEVYIQDTGHGISKENLKRIFQPFFTTKSNGTGLGLSVVHDILEQHKATIRAESEIDKGTKFIIKFPII